jgi:putative glycosyltransferase (TIGR04372 family)
MPSRLLLRRLFDFIRMFLRFPRLAPSLLARIPEKWMKTPIGERFRIAIADDLFQRDHPAESLQYLDRTLYGRRPSTDEYLLRGLCLYQGFGRFGDAMSLWTHANSVAAADARASGLPDGRFRVLDATWARHIGDTSMLDYVIKLGILEGRRREDTILYLPPGSRVANRFLLQQIARHLRMIEDPADLPFDASALQALHYDMMGPRLPDQRTVYWWDVAAKTYENWERTGRAPLFTLPPNIEARGRTVLQSVGVPRGAWFVALHVREGKWDGRRVGMHGIRNADVATYLPAISEITRRGGWVVRMGDPSMSKLPPLLNVIDYCHSGIRADWMDVFIAARCRFMVGTISGPAFIPQLYGVPAVLTNWWPPAQRAFQSFDIFIPKMVRKITDGRYLTLSETLREPVSYCHSRKHLADHQGVQVEDNDPELIQAAVVEMLARLEKHSNFSTEPSDSYSRANQIYKANRVFGMGQLASDLLRRHADFIA